MDLQLSEEITKGSEEVQMRRVAPYLFGFSGKRATA